MPHRKIRSSKSSLPGAKAAVGRKKGRMVRRAARGALLAVSFTAMQFFADDAPEFKRLFDSRVVDSLQAPLTHYHD